MNVAFASGYFEIQLVSIQNDRGELSTGQCCDGPRTTPSGTCTDPCDTFFNVCLKEYQSRATTDGHCTFGGNDTAVLGANTFAVDFDDGQSADAEMVAKATMKFPFGFGWVVSATFIFLKIK